MTPSQRFRPASRSLALPEGTGPVYPVTEFGAEPGLDALQTEALQAAIDACAARGEGGRVYFPVGVYLSGSLTLRSGVHLHLAEGAVLRGSSDFRDYGSEGWRNALLNGKGVRNVRFSGPGMIDGANAESPTGEEGFRGPHTLRFSDSEGLHLDGVTIVHSGNYAVFCQNAREISVRETKIRGGHDGLHLQACSGIVVTGTDLRTGDDCVAGTDNRDAVFEDCHLNSSCNAFRFGCDRLIVRRCTFQGPGEFAHQISVRRGAPRSTMGSAFIHFSPEDRNPQFPSDAWLIEDCRVECVEHLYHYNYPDGLWQTGQPARHLRFHNITGHAVSRPFDVRGDDARQLDLELSGIVLEQAESGLEHPAIAVSSFGRLSLQNVVVTGSGAGPAVVASHGNLIELRECSPSLSTRFDDVKDVIDRAVKKSPVRS